MAPFPPAETPIGPKTGHDTENGSYAPRTIERAPFYTEDYGGSGRLVLLVHGLGASSVHWKAVGPILAERYHPIAVEHGQKPTWQLHSSH